MMDEEVFKIMKNVNNWWNGMEGEKQIGIETKFKHKNY